MTVLIQRLNRPGTGAKIYPDSCMDAGTTSVIDVLRGWCWGGSVPISGASLPSGATLKNLALAEDGMTEDAATLLDAAAFQYGGIYFSGGGQRLKLPSGSVLAPGDLDRGWTLWFSHAPPAGATSFSNSVFSVFGGSGAIQVALILVYSAGDLSAVQMFINASAYTLPEAVRAAMSSGVVHQFGLQVERSVDLTQVRATYYLDGTSVGGTGWVASATNWAAPVTESDIPVLGRSSYWNGSGVNGHVRRAVSHNARISGAGPFREVVARDWNNNYQRIIAASGVA